MTRPETNVERKRTATTKQNTSNSSYLVEKVTPQIVSLGTKSFVIFLWVSYLKWLRIFKRLFNRFFLSSAMKFEFLFSTGIK